MMTRFKGKSGCGPSWYSIRRTFSTSKPTTQYNFATGDPYRTIVIYFTP